PELLEHTEELAVDQLHPGGPRRRPRLPARRLEGALEVVEDGQQLPDQRFVGKADVVLSLAGGPLASVVELGGGAEVSLLVSVRLARLLLQGLAQLADLCGSVAGLAAGLDGLFPVWVIRFHHNRRV